MDKQAEQNKNEWGSLFPMGVAYGMGTFNDNFFKQAALLLSAAAGLADLQSLATILFSLPFVLCSAWAGWLADRVSKQRIVIWAKFMELCAMLIGAVSLYYLYWPGIMAVIFIMGLQATIFSPALNGSIPENFTPKAVPAVNAILKLATTATILIGLALGGIIPDLPRPSFLPDFFTGHFGLLAVSFVAVLMALLGFIASLFLKKKPAASGASAPFPWLGAVDSLRHLVEFYRADPKLFATLMVEAFFYFVASVAVLLINNLGLNELGLNNTETSLMPVALMLGICIGSGLAGRCKPDNWPKLVLPAGFAMSLGLLLAPGMYLLGAESRFIYALVLFALTGVAGGMYLIPAVSFIQIRPAPEILGKTLGCSNFSSFVGIILAGVVFWPLAQLKPSVGLSLCGVGGILFMSWAVLFLRRKANI